MIYATKVCGAIMGRHELKRLVTLSVGLRGDYGSFNRKPEPGAGGKEMLVSSGQCFYQNIACDPTISESPGGVVWEVGLVKNL